MTYGFNRRFDYSGEPINANNRPKAPEYFRTQAVGGLLFTPGTSGRYISVTSPESVARLAVEDLPQLAGYLLDLYSRMKLQPYPNTINGKRLVFINQ